MTKRCLDDRVRLGDPGCRADDVGPGDQCVERGSVRTLDQLGPDLGSGGDLGLGRHVVGNHHLHPTIVEGARHRVTGDGHPVHQRCRGHRRSSRRVKSPM